MGFKNLFRGKSARSGSARSQYKFGKKIGSGQFADVYIVQKNDDPSTDYAMKVVDKSKLTTKADKEGMQLEIQVMQDIDYPGIVKLFDVHETPKDYLLLMEMARGGELFEQIVKKTKDGAFSESEAASIVRQILESLRYCHEKRIVHRDLKPENLLLEDDSPDARVKLADFGFAAYCHEALNDGCGTLVYVAPEILRADPYYTSPDMWSLGVIVYILLCGYPPFFHTEQEVLSKKIMRGRYRFREEDFGNVSQQAKDLIRHLLQRDPKKRFTAEEALAHTWIVDYSSFENTLNIDQELREFKAKMLLKRALLGIRAVNNLRQILAGYDPDADEELMDDGNTEGPQ